ncbi:hypothetical protein ACX80I_06535 [Arthrobacter sp. MDT3-44]
MADPGRDGARLVTDAAVQIGLADPLVKIKRTGRPWLVTPLQDPEYPEHMRHPPRPAKHGARLVLYIVATVLAGAAQLVAGYFYLVSGLAAPLWAVGLFLAWWLILTYVGVKLASHQSYRVLLVPVTAMVTWFGAMWVGGTFLGWIA